jgi:hypothetical protein
MFFWFQVFLTWQFLLGKKKGKIVKIEEKIITTKELPTN